MAGGEGRWWWWWSWRGEEYKWVNFGSADSLGQEKGIGIGGGALTQKVQPRCVTRANFGHGYSIAIYCSVQGLLSKKLHTVNASVRVHRQLYGHARAGCNGETKRPLCLLCNCRIIQTRGGAVCVCLSCALYTQPASVRVLIGES